MDPARARVRPGAQIRERQLSGRLDVMQRTQPQDDRPDAWYDGSAICVIAVGSHGDPLDLAEHEVEAFIAKLQRCLHEAGGDGDAKS